MIHNDEEINSRIIFIHGSESNGQTYKAQIIKRIFPDLISPDFTGPLALRLAQLESIIQETSGWTLMGSSLGGLIAAIYTLQHPEQIRNLILLAPALHLFEFSHFSKQPVKVPTVLIIGKKDDVIPDKVVYKIAKRLFPSLTYLSVDDDHRLHHYIDQLGWKNLLR